MSESTKVLEVAMVCKEGRTTLDEVKLALRLYASQSTDVQSSLEALHRRYGKHAVAAKELRAILDKALGKHTLTEKLYRIRE